MLEAAEADTGDGDDRPERPERFARRERPRRTDGDDRRPPRQQRAEQMNGEGETIPFDALPPAIGRDEPEASDETEAEPKRPRRRTRAARPAEGDDEIAPAA